MSRSALHECLGRFPGAVLELSGEGVVLASNGQLEGALGRVLVGHPLKGVLDETSHQKWSRILSAEECGEPDWPWELVFQTADSLQLQTFLVVWGDPGVNRRFWLLEHAPSSRTEKLLSEISVLNSERAETHRELARENRRLASVLRDATAAVAARDQVLAFVSHDLRNPLQAILMAADLLDLPIPQERKDIQIQVIRRAASGMSRLIEDLLTVSEAEAGRVPVERESLHLDVLFEGVCSQFENIARQKRHQLRWNVAQDVPMVAADRYRMIQVLSNLLGNAIKFTPEGGTVLVHARCDRQGVLVSVKDTGAGIPEAHLDQIFTRFWHAGRDQSGGAGLGLTIAKAVVEAHGGKIWAESIVGEGTTFFFTLPETDA